MGLRLEFHEPDHRLSLRVVQARYFDYILLSMVSSRKDTMDVTWSKDHATFKAVSVKVLLDRVQHLQEIQSSLRETFHSYSHLVTINGESHKILFLRLIVDYYHHG
jgi:hypothetical protein